MPKKSAQCTFLGLAKNNCVVLARFVNCSPFARVQVGASLCLASKGLIYNVLVLERL